VWAQALILSDISRVEGKQQVLDPDVGGVIEGGEDGVLELHQTKTRAAEITMRQVPRKGECNKMSTYKLSEVVDGVREKCGETEVVGSSDELFGRELCQVDAGEVQQRVLVVRTVLGVHL
jgi:hypothetical protein